MTWLTKEKKRMNEPTLVLYTVLLLCAENSQRNPTAEL